jgi:hypothetical protein
MNESSLPREIFKRWIYSSEKDENMGTTITYIAESSGLSGNRGRIGFEIKKNGEFIIHDSGPSDRPRKIVGHFEVITPKFLKARFKNQQRHDLSFEIVSLQDDILRVKRLSQLTR